MTDLPIQDWSPNRIAAELKQRGISFVDLARRNNLHDAACQRASQARNIPGENAIAAALDQTLWEIWPSRWRPPTEPGAEPERIDNRRKAA